ncbi:MAG: SDR family oxidoreductase [Gammaproteobacteria bacterium]|nr:SDR family oxidoreductase [Gammaproteobacteria bacterium]
MEKEIVRLKFCLNSDHCFFKNSNLSWSDHLFSHLFRLIQHLPGYVRTALIEAQIAKHALTEGISPKRAAESILGEKQPSGNFVAPTDIGAMVSFLCADTSAQITGSVFTIDGGWTAQ